MANNGPLGGDTNPGLIDDGTSALTHHRPPGPLCASRPTDTQLKRYLDQVLHRLSAATGWTDTRGAIGGLLGDGSFTAGVVAGMGKNLVTSVVDLARLFRMFALAEYHQANHAPGFWERLGHRAVYTAMTFGATSVAAVPFGIDIDREAEKAFDDRDVLFKTVGCAFEHPGEVFDKITAEQLAKYEEFKQDMARHTLSGSFHAGLLFGELLLDVLLIIDGATAIAKLGAKVPGLLRMAPRLRELAPALRRALKTGGAVAEDAGKAVERVTPSELRNKMQAKGERPPEGNPVEKETTKAAKGLGNQNPLYNAATENFKNTDLSNAGRALTKHPEVIGETKETLRQALRTDKDINDAAHAALKDIMQNGVKTTPTLGRYGTVTQIQIPSGYGARWSSDGSFIGFINP